MANRTPQDDERMRQLRAALIEGERSGQPRPFDFDKSIAEKQAGEAPKP